MSVSCAGSCKLELWWRWRISSCVENVVWHLFLCFLVNNVRSSYCREMIQVKSERSRLMIGSKVESFLGESDSGRWSFFCEPAGVSRSTSFFSSPNEEAHFCGFVPCRIRSHLTLPKSRSPSFVSVYILTIKQLASIAKPHFLWPCKQKIMPRIVSFY